MNITACIITKDNYNIAKTIKSVRSSCNEIIVVDTGSAPEYLDWLSTQGVRIFPFKWCDDFSKARNYGISKATGDWILVIDTDEVLEQEIIDMSDEFDFYFIKVGNGNEYYYNIRLFKNNLGIKYINRVHESVEKACEKLKGSLTDISVKHEGHYLPEDVKIKKIKRNYKLLLKDKKNIGRNLHFCKHYYAVGEFHKSIKYGMKVLKQKEINADNKADICICIYQAYKMLGFGDMGVDFLRLSIQILPKQVKARYLICNYLYSLQKPELKGYLLNQLQAIGSIITFRDSELSNELYLDINIVNQKIKEITQWQ